MEWLTHLADFLDKLQTYVLPHAAFVGATAILLVIGQWASGIFTKGRAYRFYGNSPRGKWKWRFFYWGRELLPVYPIAIGVALGFIWHDPENKGWNRASTIGYFASAGAVSMLLWAIAKGWSKKRGIVLQLPGESEPPEGDHTPYDEILPPRRITPTPPEDIAIALERQGPLLDPASVQESQEEFEVRPTGRPTKPDPPQRVPPRPTRRFPKP